MIDTAMVPLTINAIWCDCTSATYSEVSLDYKRNCVRAAALQAIDDNTVQNFACFKFKQHVNIPEQFNKESHLAASNWRLDSTSDQSSTCMLRSRHHSVTVVESSCIQLQSPNCVGVGSLC
jgi:hypothetical protein